MEQLRERRDGFRGVRSLMKVRATTRGKTQSFRANLDVESREKMSLTAYTPVGTVALRLFADGSQVSVENQLDGSEWEGSAEDLGRTLGFLGGMLTPAEMGLLVVGIPPREGLVYETSPAGLVSAAAGNLTVHFEPPAFPAKRVVVVRGEDRIEIDHLEVVE